MNVCTKDNAIQTSIDGTKTIYLREDYGWVYDNNCPANIGTWDSTSRIAKLFKTQNPLSNPIIIEVNNAQIDGSNVLIDATNVKNALLIENQYDILLKNFNIKNNKRRAILIQYCNNITIKDSSFTNNITAIYLIYCMNCFIKSNTFNTNYLTSNYFTQIYLNNSMDIFIDKNYISILDNNIDTTNISLSIYGISSYSSKGTITNNIISIMCNSISLKTTNIYMFIDILGIVVSTDSDIVLENNNISINKNSLLINLKSTPTANVNIKILGVFIDDCSNLKAKENIISLESNKVTSDNASISSGYSKTMLYGITLFTNSGNCELENNSILIADNIQNLISDTNFSGIALNYNNSGNKILNNTIKVLKNKFNSQVKCNGNILSGIYLSSNNKGTLIECNKVILKNNIINFLADNIYKIAAILLDLYNEGNVISKNRPIVNNNYRLLEDSILSIATASLILLYFSNYNNKIENNLLANSQFDGISFKQANLNNIIHGNLIMKNNNFGIGLYFQQPSYSSTALITIITNNCIKDNSNYGLFINTKDNYFRNSYVEGNNFISSEGMNAYVKDVSINFYQNYWSDFDGIMPYIIAPSGNEDKCPSYKPLRLSCTELDKNL